MANKPNSNPFQNIVDEVDAEVEQLSPKKTKDTNVNNEAEAAKQMLNREKAQKTLAEIYSSQAKIPVRIAPSYAKYFGRLMRVTINCVAVTIPCNGQTYNIPAEFACEVERRMREMDAYELKSNKLADVSNNYEPDIGQLSFF